MVILHGLWSNGSFHLWAERATVQTAEEASPNAAGDAQSPALRNSTLLDADELRAVAGDTWDSLLISGAVANALTLVLPQIGARLIASTSSPGAIAFTNSTAKVTLLPTSVPALRFAPADAIDLLTSCPAFSHSGVAMGGALRYWCKAAALVVELLAAQRFVPAVHSAGDHAEGYWRVIADEAATAARIRTLITAMPPVCLAGQTNGHAAPAVPSAVLENFLFSTVDALVRRSLEGDDLAQSLQEAVNDDAPLQVQWLRSLVGSQARIKAAPDSGRRIAALVDQWLARLEPPQEIRPYRVIFRLLPPSEDVSTMGRASWQIHIRLQTADDPTLGIDAEKLLSEEWSDPPVLRRPLLLARRHLRSDLARAAEHFAPMAECAKADGPLTCSITLEEAYLFLRDAAPLLEREGFGVELPRWWAAERPRLRMRMEVNPVEAESKEESALSLNALVSYNWRVAVGDDELTLDEITRLASAKEPLVKIRGRWAELRPGELQSAIDFVRAHRGDPVPLMEALRRFYLAEDNETGVSVVGLSATGWVAGLLNAPDLREEFENVAQPAGFAGELRPYQRKGLAWFQFLMKHSLGACLADDMGLGKTIQLIALWLSEREGDRNPGPTLLVVPMSVVGNWKREIGRFGPSIRVLVHHGMERLTGQDFVHEVGRNDVIISTYGLAHRDFEHLMAIEWHRVALDEAQNIKNPSAKQSAALRMLRARHRVALTGTPVENRLSELWSILDFLNPGYLGTASEFRQKFAIPIEKNHQEDRALRLRHLIRPFVLRRLKSDPTIMPDLPDKMEMKVLCNLTKEQAALYEAIVKDMLAQIDLADGMQRRGLILATLVKLKQVCNHPAHLLGDQSLLPHRSGKCDRLTEMLDEVVAEGDRALVFTQFKEMGSLLCRLLEETLGRPVLFLHGGTTQKGRDALVDRFQDPTSDAPVFILSLKAGGFGLNLTAANHVFHFDRWWNPAVEDQATDRAHRIGQTRRVQVHKFICIGTLEERIDQLIALKKNLADRIVGSGEEWLTELSTDALRELFALSREAVSEE